MEIELLRQVYELFLNNIPYPIWIESTNKTIIFINQYYEKLFNTRLEEIIGKKNEEAFSKEKAIFYNKQIDECLKRNDVYVLEDIINERYMQHIFFPLLGKNSEVKGVASILIDIDDRKSKELEIEKQKNILRTIIDAVPESIFYKDKESRFIGFNKKFEEFYKKRGVKEIIGKSDIEIYDNTAEAIKFIKQDKNIMKTKKAKYFEHRIEKENGNTIIEENLKIPVINEKGEAWGIVGLSRDITERKMIEEKLKTLSETDILTGLYNRYSFEQKSKELNKEKYLPLGIIMGDVNGLKIVNDTLGHLEGDNLLKSISHVLKETCDNNSYVFRWGGDEFIILISNCDENKCEEYITKIREKCEEVNYKFIKLSIALGEGIKYSIEEDIYECITRVEEKVYRQKLLEKKSVKSSIMESLKKTLEEKNMETGEHTERVTHYALEIGKRLKLKISELDELALVASIHDIGKIGVSEDILLKPDKLTKEEFEIMKTHTEIGYRIINASSELVSVAKSVLMHHEKWNGTGYPLGLAKEEIPLIARIINVADSYDVMTNDRVYKKAMSKDEAIKELEKYSGEQFDPVVVKAFTDYLNNKN